VRRAALLGVLVVALAGCGSGSETVPGDAVAVVDGEEITREEYDELVARTKKSYESQKRAFPEAGSTAFRALKSQFVRYLVQREEMRQEAADLELTATDAQVEERLKQVKEQYFSGDAKRYEQQLRENGLTDQQVRADIRDQILSEKIFASVTGEVKATDAEIRAHYAGNREQYGQPETREVRHILVRTKAKADELYARLRAGADFAALAKANSADTGSKDDGGKLTIARGQTVPEFDAKAFALRVNELSTPVKTQFGFHIIEAVGPVQPAKTTPLADVRETIEQQVLQQKKSEKMADWAAGLDERYEGRISYQTGFTPQTTAKATTAATATVP
jgi:parvulin-like peptidyl-prolyl isomerase